MAIPLVDHDKNERLLALDASQSFIVQAPAGSGKTELLIQRFLTLLNCVNAPEEILAITFTKKAAREMRSRVVNALKQALLEPEPSTQHAKQTWLLAKRALQRDQQFNWNLIQNPNQIRIQTIDSLCTYLTKQLPLLSHFGSAPQIADNPAFLYREAVQEVLSHVEQHFEWSQAISKLLIHLDNDLNKLHDLLVSLLARRDQWLSYIHVEKNAEHIKKQLEKQLKFIIEDSLNTIIDIFPHEWAEELMMIARFAADQLALTHPDSPLLACRELTDLPDCSAENKVAWLGIAKLLLTKTGSFRKRLDQEIGFPALTSLKNPQEKSLHTDYRQRFTALLSALNDHEDLRLALSELFFLPEPYYQEKQWEILQALLHVLKIVTAQLRVTFQQHGQIDFIENAQAALLALGNEEYATDLALALDYQIKHLLVDEFQDTSSTQYQLLEKLVTGWEPQDGRTLFVVGDPMQSIYRFREAEVGLFIRMRKNGIGNVKLTPLTLSVNFRSTPAIVQWNNFHFQHIFPPLNDIGSGAVTYSQSVSHQLAQDDEAPAIEIRGFINTNEEAEATHIADQVLQTKASHPNDNIAILVRSRGHLNAIIPALKKARITYQAVDIDPLAARPAIQDLLALTCALLHPADRIAWLSVLRAPWCGLILADLLIIAGENPYTAIWEQLISEAVFAKLSADGQKRLAKILVTLKSKTAERERYPLRYWIESTWILLGGPATLREAADIEDAQAFFKLLDEFNQRHTIIHLDKLKEKMATLFASTQQEEAQVHIMTIHTAKGLEFDTVILPHLERKIPHDEKSLLLWMEQPLSNDQIALLLAPHHATGTQKDSIYEYIHRQQKIRADYETDRLLYVATTRAKKRLHLLFNAVQKEVDIKIEPGSFLAKLWPFIEKQKDTFFSNAPLTTEKKASSQEKSRQLTRLTTDWQSPIHDILEKDIAFHQQLSGFQLIDSVPKIIGIVAHRILQQLAEYGVEWWQRETADKHKLYLHQQLHAAGLLPHHEAKALPLIQTIITHALNDARGQWILAAHEDAQSEFALTAVIDNKMENLIIDRTFVTKEGVRWIIDYKTTAFSSEDLDYFLEKEQEKYLEKMHKYYAAMRLIDSRPIHLGLYFPALPAWREWIFPA